MPSINSNINASIEETYSGLSPSVSYYFADDYKIVFDSEGPLFQLLGRYNEMVNGTLQNMKNSGNISETPYTCLETMKNGTCRNLYKVNIINNETSFTGITYSVNLQMQIAQNVSRTSLNGYTVYYWGEDYEIIYDDEGPLFKLKTGNNQIIARTLTEMRDDPEQLAMTPYWCGSNANGECRRMYKVTTISSGLAAFTGDRYHYSPLSKEDSQKNQLDSLVKKQADTWYETKFMNNLNNGTAVTEYIVDGTFCNDRNITRTNNSNSGYLVTAQTYFAGRTRFWDATPPNINATLICAKDNDKFSVTSTYGNAKLTYPIALITADEVALAGGKYSEKNLSYWLRTNGEYWTMTPSYYSSTIGSSGVFSVDKDGLFDNAFVTATCGLRPVINLNAHVRIIQGDGTTTNPYVIE